MNYKLEVRKIEEMCLPPTKEYGFDVAQSLFQLFGILNKCHRCSEVIDGYFWTTYECSKCESLL